MAPVVTQIPEFSAPPPRRGLTVLAVDDELPALDELEFALMQTDPVTTVLTASDATTALRLITDSPTPIDAVFLDINMPGLDGLELARVLGAFADPPSVVFVTAHDDRAVRAFDLGAVDYLLKPLRTERLAEAVGRVVDHRAAPSAAPGPAHGRDADEVLAVEIAGITTLVPRSDVRWVEAVGDYARLHTDRDAHLVRTPLSTLENRWQHAGFVRVHRSYLVHLPSVTSIRTAGSQTVVCLRAVGDAPGVELPVSRRHTRELKDRLVGGRSPGPR